MKDTVNSILKKGNKCIVLGGNNYTGIIKEVINGKVHVDCSKGSGENIIYKIDELAYWSEEQKSYFNIQMTYEELIKNELLTNLYS